MVQPIAQRYIGSPIKRSEDTRILTGTGSYVDDIALPGMLHAAFVRSPVAHARITSVDTAAAREAPGVVAVVTGEELEAKIVPGPTGIAAMMGGSSLQYTTLCTDKVRLVGDPIVMVVAESRYEAEDACELVEVDYDDLPAVASAEAAIDPASPPIFENHGSNVLVEKPPVVFGDVDGAFARADRVVTAHLRQHRHQNVPMEGRGLVASFDPATQELTVTAATQGVHMVRSTLANCLGLEPDQVRVLAGDIGGSFGLKFGASREEVAVAALSKELGRPGQVDRGPQREPDHLGPGPGGELRRRGGHHQRGRHPGLAGPDVARFGRLPGYGRDGRHHHAVRDARSLQDGGAVLRDARSPSPTRPATWPTGGRGRPRRLCGNA